MNQFEGFLNTLIKEGTRKEPFDNECHGISYSKLYNKFEFAVERGFYPNYSLNDILFDHKSGLMEAVKRKDSGEKKKTITINPSLPNCFDVLHDDIPDYHRIQLVLLKTDEERVKYVLNNKQD